MIVYLITGSEGSGYDTYANEFFDMHSKFFLAMDGYGPNSAIKGASGRGYYLLDKYLFIDNIDSFKYEYDDGIDFAVVPIGNMSQTKFDQIKDMFKNETIVIHSFKYDECINKYNTQFSKKKYFNREIDFGEYEVEYIDSIKKSKLQLFVTLASKCGVVDWRYSSNTEEQLLHQYLGEVTSWMGSMYNGNMKLCTWLNMPRGVLYKIQKDCSTHMLYLKDFYEAVLPYFEKLIKEF